jgi:hypothetical protein
MKSFSFSSCTLAAILALTSPIAFAQSNPKAAEEGVANATAKEEKASAPRAAVPRLFTRSPVGSTASPTIIAPTAPASSRIERIEPNSNIRNPATQSRAIQDPVGQTTILPSGIRETRTPMGTSETIMPTRARTESIRPGSPIALPRTGEARVPSTRWGGLWATERLKWDARKTAALDNLKGAPKEERLRKEYQWLTFVQPQTPYEEYFKNEDFFFIALAAQEWSSSRQHLQNMLPTLKHFDTEAQSIALLSIYDATKQYPDEAVGGDGLWKHFIEVKERQGQWQELADYFINAENPRFSVDRGMHYFKRYVQQQNVSPLQAFKLERSWLLQHDPSEIGQFYRLNSAQPWFVWWWNAQYQWFCQQQGTPLRVNANGMPASTDRCQ